MDCDSPKFGGSPFPDLKRGKDTQSRAFVGWARASDSNQTRVRPIPAPRQQSSGIQTLNSMFWTTQKPPIKKEFYGRSMRYQTPIPTVIDEDSHMFSPDVLGPRRPGPFSGRPSEMKKPVSLFQGDGKFGKKTRLQMGQKPRPLEDIKFRPQLAKDFGISKDPDFYPRGMEPTGENSPLQKESYQIFSKLPLLRESKQSKNTQKSQAETAANSKVQSRYQSHHSRHLDLNPENTLLNFSGIFSSDNQQEEAIEHNFIKEEQRKREEVEGYEIMKDLKQRQNQQQEIKFFFQHYFDFLLQCEQSRFDSIPPEGQLVAGSQFSYQLNKATCEKPIDVVQQTRNLDDFGYLPRINCFWSSEQIPDGKTRLSIIKLNGEGFFDDSKQIIFRQELPDEISHLNVFNGLPAKDDKQELSDFYHTKYILAFGRGKIFVFQATVIASNRDSGAQEYNPFSLSHSLHPLQSDDISIKYLPDSDLDASGIRFTKSIQHQKTGLIIAGGSKDGQAQAISINLKSLERKKDQFALKLPKAVEGVAKSLTGKQKVTKSYVKQVGDFFSHLFFNVSYQVKCLTFCKTNPSLLAVLTVPDQNPFHDAQVALYQVRDDHLLDAISNNDSAYLVLLREIRLKDLYRRSRLRYMKYYDGRMMTPVNVELETIQSIGTLKITMENGISIYALNFFDPYNESQLPDEQPLFSILSLSPLDTTIGIHRLVELEVEEKRREETNQNSCFFSDINPILPTIGQCERQKGEATKRLNFVGDCQVLEELSGKNLQTINQLFNTPIKGLASSCAIIAIKSFSSGFQNIEVIVVSGPRHDNYLMLLERSKQFTIHHTLDEFDHFRGTTAHVGLVRLPDNFTTTEIWPIRGGKSVRLVSKEGQTLIVNFQTLQDQLADILNLQDKIQTLAASCSNFEKQEVYKKMKETLWQDTARYFDALFRKFVRDASAIKTEEQSQFQSYSEAKGQHLYNSQFFEGLETLLQLALSVSLGGRKHFYVQSKYASEYYLNYVHQQSDEHPIWLSHGQMRPEQSGLIQPRQSRQWGRNSLHQPENLQNQEDSYFDFIVSRNQQTSGLTLTPMRLEIQQEARSLLKKLLDRYFNPRSQHSLVGQYQETMMIDLRDYKFEHLKFESSPPQIQARTLLVYSTLVQSLGSISGMNKTPFSFNKNTKQVELSPYMSQKLIEAQISQLSQLEMLVGSDFFEGPQNDRTRTLIKVLGLLLTKSLQGLDFFHSFLLQQKERRMKMLNDKLFMRDHKTTWQKLLYLDQHHGFHTKILPEQYAGLKFGSFIVLGPMFQTLVRKIVETLLTHDDGYEPQRLANRFSLFLEKELFEVSLFSKYMIKAKEASPHSSMVTALSQKVTDTVASWVGQQDTGHSPNEFKDQLMFISHGRKFLDNRSTVLVSDLKVMTKHMLANKMYTECLQYCLKRAKVLIDAQTYLVQQHLQQKNESQQRDHDEIKIAAATEQIEKELSQHQDSIDQVFSFLLEFLEELISRIKTKEKQMELAKIYRDTAANLIPLGQKQIAKEGGQRSDKYRQLTILDRIRSTMGCSRYQNAQSAKKEDFFEMMAGEIESQNEKQQLSQFEAINDLREQIRKLPLEILLELKQQTLSLVAGPEVSRSENKKLVELECKEKGLDTLHREIFMLLMKHNLVDNLFQLRSPFIQEFIEKELWKIKSASAEKSDLEGVPWWERGMDRQKLLKFEAIVEAMTKHFLRINQPLKLFDYIYDTLVVSGENEEMQLHIEKRQSTLDLAVSCLPEEAQLGGEVNLSVHAFNLTQKVTECKDALQILSFVKVVFLPNIHSKLDALIQDVEYLKEEKDQEGTNFDVQKLEMEINDLKEIIVHLTYGLVQGLQGLKVLLQIAVDYELWESQLRILRLMASLNESQDLQEDEAAKEVISTAWVGLIEEEFGFKCINSENGKIKIDDKKLQSFIDRVLRLKRLLSQPHIQSQASPFTSSKKKENIKHLNLFPLELVVSQVMMQMQQKCIHMPLKVLTESKQLYWITTMLKSNSWLIGDSSSPEVSVFDLFIKIIDSFKAKPPIQSFRPGSEYSEVSFSQDDPGMATEDHIFYETHTILILHVVRAFSEIILSSKDKTNLDQFQAHKHYEFGRIRAQAKKFIAQYLEPCYKSEEDKLLLPTERLQEFEAWVQSIKQIVE